MTLEEFLQPGTMHLVGAAITGLISLQTVFLKWLIDNFKGLRSDLTYQARNTQEWLKDHEEKDQLRHEENLSRFERIGIALARMGHLSVSEEEFRSATRPKRPAKTNS